MDEANKVGTLTLADRLSTNNNALNFVRLVLATLVIFGHAFPLGDFEPLVIGSFTLGAWHGTAVECFFVASGYLILASGMRMRAKPFLWRRFLRIYPGYLIALLATAFIFSPLGKVFGAEWKLSEALYFFFKSLTLKSGDLPVNADVPFAVTWNGSLWTLFYEALAYVGVCLFVMVPWVRKHLKPAVIVLATLMVLISLFIPSSVYTFFPGPLEVIIANGVRLWTFFAVGMLFYVFADKIPASLPLAVIACLVTLSLVSTSHNIWGSIIIFVAMPYMVLALGATLPTRIGTRNDISYGIYVYAFPVQQLLVLAGITQYGWFFTAFSCFALTLPLAFLSWHFIEKPAMRFKRLVPTGLGSYTEKIA